jgi:hypothetical protein
MLPAYKAPTPRRETAEQEERVNQMLKTAIAEEQKKRLTGDAPKSQALPVPDAARKLGGIPIPGADVAVGLKGKWDSGPSGAPKISNVTVEIGARTPVGGMGVKGEIVDDKAPPPPPKK